MEYDKVNMAPKQEFANACNNENGLKFIQASTVYLGYVSTKDELNDFVNMFGKISRMKSFEASVELTGLCLALRDKVYDILIANGDVPESDYIYLYDYFALCSLPEDARYTAYEQFVDQNLYTEGVSDMERVYLIVLRFFASMVNSREYAFERFLLSSMRLHLLEVGSVGFSKFVSDYLNNSRIEIESILPILEKLWDKDLYFSLDKTQRRSTFNWSLHSLWLVQKYFNHPLWVSLYLKWKEIFYEHIERDECDEAMYVHFFIYHKMGNSFQTQDDWKMFNDEIDRPASEYYKAWCERASLPKCKASVNSGKKIIGFLWDRVVDNSPFKVAYSLWKALYSSDEFRANYEIKIYVMSYFEKSGNDQKCIDMIERLGIEVFDGAEPFYKDGLYHSHLAKALYIRQQMLHDGVDIMIHGSCYDINDFLVSSRLAPRQIFWSHGNHEYDVSEIDKKITHCGLQGCDYRFESFSVPMDMETFYNPYRDPRLIEHERARYPKDTFILGVIGRLVKVDSDEYLETIAKIMRQNPNTIFIAAGSGNIESIRAKAEKLGISDRFYMPGHVDAHVYGHIIDLWCDTFPLEGGEAVSEYAVKGNAFIAKINPNKPISNNENVERACIDDIYSRFGKEAKFISIGYSDLDRVKSLGKIVDFIEKNKQYVYLADNVLDIDILEKRYSVKSDKFICLEKDDIFDCLCDVKVSFYCGELDMVDRVIVQEFYGKSYCGTPANWVDIFIDNKNTNFYNRHSRMSKECSIEGFLYNHFTAACSYEDYIYKTNYLIKNGQVRKRIGSAYANNLLIDFDASVNIFLQVIR